MKKTLVKIIYSLAFLIALINVNYLYPQGTVSNIKIETAPNTNNQNNTSFQLVIDNWILPITKILTLISIIVGICISINQYKLKVNSEIRLKESANAENDVKLLKLFTEIFDIAHGRKNHIISETIIKELFDKDIFTEEELNNLEALNNKIENAANLPIHVGLGAQDAAIVAIANLSIKYEILKAPGLAGLLVIKDFKPDPTTACINRINNPL